MKSFYILLFFLSFCGAVSSFAQAGSLDPEFGGGDGLVSTSIYADQRAEGEGIALQNDGKILVAGSTKAPDGVEYAVLVRYMTDGALDNSFNGSGKKVISTSGNSYAEAVLAQPDGKIILLVTVGDTADSKVEVFRFLPDGSPDNTFDSDGKVVTSLGSKDLSANALALQADGKIVVSGYVSDNDGLRERFFIIRYLANGTPDTGFDGDGIVITAVGENYVDINAMVIQPDGKIIIAGEATFNNNFDFALARYNANGSLDHSFDGDGIASFALDSSDDRILSVALQPDGKIVCAGYARNPATNSFAFAAARLTPNGKLDNSFHGNGVAIISITGQSDGARDMILQPDGKIVLGGYAHSIAPGGFDMALVRLNPDGLLDFDFDGDGIKIYEDNLETENDILGMALQSDGKIVATGVTRFNGLNAIKVARFITGLTTSTKEEIMPLTAVSLYPNPVYEKVIVKYDLDHAETISINLCDVQGRIVQQLMSSSERNPGNHTEELAINQGLPAGNYVVHIQSRNGSKALKMVLN